MVTSEQATPANQGAGDPSGAVVEHSDLQRGAVGLTGVLMQSVTTIAPAIAGLVTLPFIVSNAGNAAPLAYLGAFVIALMLGFMLTQFAKHITSAGTWYTFLSRSLGARVGFLFAWMYLLIYPLVIPQIGAFMGSTLESTLKAEYGVTFHWWWFMLALIVVVALTAYWGITLSVRLIVVFGLFEIVVVLALALFGFASPGAGGVNLDWLNPGNSPTGHGFFLAIVFAIFAIGGWDAAAPIGEESRNPRRNVPRGVIGSILILGAFLVFASWGQLSGWGTLHADKLAASPELPAFVLGHKYWGGAWIILLIALLNSSLAVSIAVTNASVRIFYAMARSGVLPRQMSVVHPKHKTPVNAIIFQTAVNLVLGVGLAFAVGQNNVYNVTGLMATFALAPVLIVANVGMTVFYWRDHRQDFNVLKHVLVPIVSSAALVLVVYYSLNPAPAYPASLAAPITIGWLVLGLGVLFTMLRLGKRAWLVHAGAAVAEEPLH